MTIGMAEYGSDETEYFHPRIAAAFKKTNKLKAAVTRQIDALKASAAQMPECADEYQNMAWGVFGLWMDLAGYEPTDENEEIAAMRDYCTEWTA